VSAKKPEANQTGGENEARGKGNNDVGGEQSGQHPSENANPSNKQDVTEAQGKNGDANSVAPGTLAAAVAIAQSQAEEQSGADVKERAEEIGKVEQRLRHDVEIQDLGAWSKDWKHMETLLQDAPTLFDVNKPFRIGTPPDTELAAGDAESEGRTYLGRVAELGWLPGVKGLVEWDQGRNDTGPRLRIDDGGIDPPNAKLSPLTLATENSETISSAEKASVVRYLLMQRASAMVPDQRGRTPLELAAAAGDADVIEALLVNGSALGFGLSALQLDLAKQLQRLDRRWPFGSDKAEQNNDLVNNDMLAKVSDFGIAISRDEKNLLSGNAELMVTLYKNRVMHALSTAPNVDTDDVIQAKRLLFFHMFDSFARDYILSVIIGFGMLGIFHLFTYFIYRIRLFGGPEVPVSMAFMVPGAFNPLRLADPDFDPSRHIHQKFPYKATKGLLAQSPPSIGTAIVAFIKAVLGVFSAWGVLAVRIPPMKDQFDEDFLSDDDEDSRKKVCEQCAVRARCAHRMEVLLRITLVGTVLWWICWQSQRWVEASILIFVYLQFSLIAASAAAAVVTPTTPDTAAAAAIPDVEDEILDSALLVYALFGVQHGPRWARSISTTRSTAAPSKTRLARRQRSKRAKSRCKSEEVNDITSGTEDQQLDKNEKMSSAGAVDDVLGSKEQFFGSWQRSFLQVGMMHIEHREYLKKSVASMIWISFIIMWLIYLHIPLQVSYLTFYAKLSPMALFEVYGTPGSAARAGALLLELALVFLVCERLHSIVGLLQVAALSLQQRHRALGFVSDHPPPPVAKSVSSPQEIAKDTERLIEESSLCGQFASELSALRWSVLRTPVLLIFAMNLMLLALAIIAMICRSMEESGDAVQWRIHAVLQVLAVDPTVPLGVAFCFVMPLSSVLFAAALTNGQVYELRQRLRHEVSSKLSDLASGQQIDDVQYVDLRLKGEQAELASLLCWPGGRELSLCEPAVLIVISALAFACGISTGAVLPCIAAGRSH
jgi:hypothetical protein